MEKKKTLVIDDEQIVLDSVSKILAAENYEVDVSLSGREAVDWALKRQYDIVLTDILMPDIGGMKVVRHIKRDKPSLPVVMIPGYATVKAAVQAMKLGAADYLEKPFTPDELLKAVGSALDKAATQAPEEQAIIHKEEIIKVLSAVRFVARRRATGGRNHLDVLQRYCGAFVKTSIGCRVLENGTEVVVGEL